MKYLVSCLLALPLLSSCVQEEYYAQDYHPAPRVEVHRYNPPHHPHQGYYRPASRNRVYQGPKEAVIVHPHAQGHGQNSYGPTGSQNGVRHSSIHGHGNTQVHGHGNTQVHGHGNTQVHGHGNTQVHGHGNTQVHGQGSTQVQGNTQLHGHSTETQGQTNAHGHRKSQVPVHASEESQTTHGHY